ncbi:MAG: NAD(P)H-dependent oxidoreductase [Gordonia sp. (in: high G+C Gram-positive bacteria)]
MNTTSLEPDHRLRLAVIVGSTRPGRRSRLVADWAHEAGRSHLDDRATIDLIDLADFDLPLLDEPQPAAMGSYSHDHTLRWAQTVEHYDGFIFVVPEYNHSFPAAVKNAIDFLFAEWNNKAAGFVSFGLAGGVRAAEQLRPVLAEVNVATVRSQVALNLVDDFALPDMTAPGTLTPSEQQHRLLNRMLDELVDWSAALRTIGHRTRS